MDIFLNQITTIPPIKSSYIGELTSFYQVLSNSPKFYVIIFALMVIIPALAYLIYKLKIGLDSNKYQKELKESNDKINTIDKSTEKLLILKNKLDIEIDDIKSMYFLEIEQLTDIKLTKAIEYIDEWLTTFLVNDPSTNLNDRCIICKSVSLDSALDNLTISLKEDFRNALNKNGFLDLKQPEFNKYVEEKCSVFRKTIRETLRKYYIHPQALSDSIKLSKDSYDKTILNVESVFYGILDGMKEKENRMIEKINSLKEDYSKEIKTLLPNITMEIIK
jgi:hypothetical protein